MASIGSSNAQRTTHNAQRTTHNAQLAMHNSQCTTRNANSPLRERHDVATSCLTFNEKLTDAARKVCEDSVANIYYNTPMPDFSADAEKLGVNLQDVQTVLYPCGQTDILTALQIVPNATKIILTGVEGEGPTSFEEHANHQSYSQDNISYVMRSGNVTSGNKHFMSSRDFWYALGNNLKRYPTLLILAATLHGAGAKNISIKQSDHGHVISCTHQGIAKEIEYIDIGVSVNNELFTGSDTTQNQDQLNQKLEYISQLPTEVVIHKASPFKQEFLNENPHLKTILGQNQYNQGALMISDQSLQYNYQKVNRPTSHLIAETNESTTIATDNNPREYGSMSYVTRKNEFVPQEATSTQIPATNLNELYRSAFFRKYGLN